ncbi:hypothetical protein O3M35_009230 [Rhynocoris fuscipes]|uniref:Uncharacterized protein n=1 Tax=Rhynocoris fuscipes TaxID=488301 RepID=A0AAW1D4U2_9HEMI
MLKWWISLLKMPSDRLPKAYYDRLFNLLDNYELPFNWVADLRLYIYKVGAVNLLLSQNAIEIEKQLNNIVTSFQNNLISKDIDKVLNSNFNNYYGFLCPFCLDNHYLNLNIHINKLRIVAKLRVASKKIPKALL